MRVLVCGGRDFTDYGLLCKILEEIGPTVIIAGGARGADTLAKIWARSNSIDYEEYRAEWEKYDKAAGPIRNKKMLEEGNPDLVVAFPGGSGTANMIMLSKKANKIIKIIS